MKKSKRIISLMLSCILTLTLAACGSSVKPTLDDQAALRNLGEGAGQVWIDDQAIALSGTAVSSLEAREACTKVLKMMNQQRAEHGIASLAWSNSLADAAQVRANEIVDVFSHTRPNGSAFWTVDSSVQYGENLAKYYQSADSVYSAWMNSQSHAANIMSNDFKTVGIAISQADDGSWYWAQEFGYY